MIAAGVLGPHQKSSLLGPSPPVLQHLRLLSSCSSHPAGAGLWWLALSPPTSLGYSAEEGNMTDRKHNEGEEDLCSENRKKERCPGNAL